MAAQTLCYMLFVLSWNLFHCLKADDCSAQDKNSLSFTIKLDRWAEEVSWQVLSQDTHHNNVIFSGNGNYSDGYTEKTETSCIDAGCYLLEINDTYGDGIYSTGYWGWFTLKLNDNYITIGEQTFDGDYTHLYFCTQLFSSYSDNSNNNNSLNNDIIDLSIETYDYNSEFYILNGDTSDYNILYYNNYEFPDFINKSVTNSLYLTNKRDISGAYCYKIFLDNGYTDTKDAFYKISYKIINDDDINDAETTYSRIGGDVSDLSFDICKNDSYTSSPTPAPTFGETDILFNVGNNNKFKTTTYVGCNAQNQDTSGIGCTNSVTFEIINECDNPRLTVKMYESDFDYPSEQAYVFINDNYLGNCEPLHEACTNEFSICNITDQKNITNYLIENSDGNLNIEVGIACSSEVNVCGYSTNSSLNDYGLSPGIYNCLGEITIQCDVYDGITTSVPTPMPTIESVTHDEEYNLTVTITFDSHPEYLSWLIYDSYNSQYLTYQSGSSYKAYSTYVYSQIIGYGCYWIYFPGTNNTQDEFFGYYKIELNGVTITQGAQPIGPAYNDSTSAIFGIFEFCTTFLDPPTLDEIKDLNDDKRSGYTAENTIEIETYNFNGEIIFVDNSLNGDFSGDLIYATIYYTNENADLTYNVPIINTLPVKDGCYLVVFYEYGYNDNAVSNTNDDDTNGYYSLTLNNNYTIISIEDSEDGYYTYVDFCTNDTGSDKAVYYQNNYTQDITQCDENSGNNNIGLLLNIKFDDWPEEVSWTVKSETSNSIILAGNGDKSDEFEDLYHGTCISDGCYILNLYDEYGDGMYHMYDDYGWYRLYLDDNIITLGKQAVEGKGSSLYFCTNIFVNGRNNLTIDTTPNNDDYNHTNFSIYGGQYANTLEYDNQYIVPGFLRDSESVSPFDDKTTLTVKMGCYKLYSNNEFSVRMNDITGDVNYDTAIEKYVADDVCGVKFDSGYNSDNGKTHKNESTLTTKGIIIVVCIIIAIVITILLISIIIIKMKNGKLDCKNCCKKLGKYGKVDEEEEANAAADQEL